MSTNRWPSSLRFEIMVLHGGDDPAIELIARVLAVPNPNVGALGRPGAEQWLAARHRQRLDDREEVLPRPPGAMVQPKNFLM